MVPHNRIRCDARGDNPAMHPGLTPPDIESLPALPERFAWQLPHVKQHRRPMPEGRQIVVDGDGPAVASMQPRFAEATVVVGLHRWLQSDRRQLRFSTRETALRYLAAWAWRYSDAIAAEVEAVRARNSAPAAGHEKGRLEGGRA